MLPSYVEGLKRLGIDVAAEEGFPIPQWSEEAHLQFMADAGLDYAVLSMPTPHTYHGDAGLAREVTRAVNEEYAAFCRKHPEKFGFVAALPLPDAESYGDFPQIENGVGLLRLFELDFREALEDRKPLSSPRHVTVAGGVAANPFFRGLYKYLDKYNIYADVVPVQNRFFGGNVHVAGLVTAGDIEAAFPEKGGEPLLIPRNMLREKDDVFLDGVKLSELEEKLGRRILPFGGGREFIELVFGDEL